MQQLTALESALLEQFEKLAQGLEANSGNLQTLSERIGQRVKNIEVEQERLKTRLDSLTGLLNSQAELLNSQKEHTKILIASVNQLLDARQ